MAQKHLYRDIDGTLTDMSAFVPRLQWTAQSKAEEGAYGSWSVTLFDPNGELDGVIAPNVVGHRQWFVEDDESEDEDDIIFGGFVGAQTFAKFDGTERAPAGPKARVITIELIDANTWFSKIVLRSADVDRPVETDVERVQALLALPEAAQIVDTTTFVDTSGPVDMDKASYRATYFAQGFGDCASASGKNWFLWYRKVSGIRTLTFWYGRDTLADYESPFLLTNDRSYIDRAAIEDGTATVWDLSKDATMRRSPERQYCGNYVQYGSKQAAVYRHSAANHAIIASYGSGHRDMISTFPLVKTKAKAQARGDRQLVDVHPQDVVITTTMARVPSTRVTLAKAGMRVQVKGTHWGPTCDDWHYGRIVTAQPRPHSKGDLYDIELEIVLGGDSPGPPLAPPAGATAGALLWEPGDVDDNPHTTTPIHFASTGDDPGAGMGYVPIDSTNFAYIPDTLYGGAALGFEVLCGRGILDLYLDMTIADAIVGPDRTYTVQVLLNGGVVGSDAVTQPAGGFSHTFVVNVNDLDVVAGDLLTVQVTTSALANFVSPSGVNTLAQYFAILDSSVVATP